MPGRIELKDISFLSGSFPVLRSISLTVKKGDVFVIGGKSGQGKSTFLEICAGLKKPHSGNVLWDGVDLAGFSWRELLRSRQNIGYVFQVHALISNHSVFENIALPLRARGGFTEKELQHKVRSRMEDLGLFNIDSLFPESLSIGQLKAVAVARALACEPDMLLLDEPLSGVDPFTAQGIMNVLYENQLRRSMGIIMVSHNLSIWEGLDPVKLMLDSGRLTEPSGLVYCDRQYGEEVQVFK